MSAILDRLAPSKSCEGRDLGDEYLFYDSRDDKLHVLNGTAREIYLMCDGTRGVEEIALLLMEKHELDLSTARHDTLEALQRMLDLGLLE